MAAKKPRNVAFQRDYLATQSLSESRIVEGDKATLCKHQSNEVKEE